MNSKMKIQIALFLLVFALIIAAIWLIMSASDPSETSEETGSFPFRTSLRQSNKKETEPTSSPLSSPTPTVEPIPSAIPAETIPEAVSAAAPSPSVSTPATPIPTPTLATPEPAGLPLGSGTISSGKPWLLNIHADWSAVTAAGNRAQVEVIVYADHYSISYNAFESLVIRLGEESHRMLASALHSDNNMPQSTELGRYTYNVPLPPGETVTLPLSAVWEFEGTYGDGSGNGIYIQSLRCEGTITLSH